MGGPGAVDGDQQVASPAGWDLADCPGQHPNVIIGVVRACAAAAQVHGQALAGVVAEHRDGVVAEPAPQPLGQFLVRGRVDEVRIDAQHDLFAEVAGGHLGRGDAAVPGD